MSEGKFALLIGASQFDDSRLAKLAAPKNDIEALENVLRDPARCGFSTVSSVLDQRLEDVQQALSNILDANHSSENLILIYYTGHGLRDERGDLYFALKGTEKDSPHVGSIDADWLRRALERCSSRRQVLILDCCYAGAFLDGSKSTSAEAVVNERTFDPEGHGRFILAASASGQSAFEKDGVSLYTRHIVNALYSGDAAPDQKFITTHDVHNYVAQQVKKQRPFQRPCYWADVKTEVIRLARNPNVRLPIPEKLRIDLIAENRTTRLGAITEIKRYLDSSNPTQREEAQRLLDKRLIDDAEDSVSLTREIRQAVGEIEPEERIALLQAKIEEIKNSDEIAKLQNQINEFEVKENSWLKAQHSWRQENKQLNERVIALETTASAPAVEIAKLQNQISEFKVKENSWLEAQHSWRQEKEQLNERVITLETTARAPAVPTPEQKKRLRILMAMTALVATIATSSITKLIVPTEISQTRIVELEQDSDKIIKEGSARDTILRYKIASLELELTKRGITIPNLFGLSDTAWIEGEPGKPGSIFREKQGMPEMVIIPSGSFQMGSVASEQGHNVDEGPQLLRSINTFALSQTEVTFAQWQTCVDGGGCKKNKKPDDNSWGYGDRPVIYVSWSDTKEYIAWINSQVEGSPYRLPKEDEWEYAARANETTPFWTGETISTTQANYYGNDTYGDGKVGLYRKKTIPVGSLNMPNPFRLHDVHGNVWEWTEDCYGRYTDVYSDCSRRVIRGGSWLNDRRVLRAAKRISVRPHKRSDSIGFRLARTILHGTAPSAHESTEGHASYNKELDANAQKIEGINTLDNLRTQSGY